MGRAKENPWKRKPDEPVGETAYLQTLRSGGIATWGRMLPSSHILTTCKTVLHEPRTAQGVPKAGA